MQNKYKIGVIGAGNMAYAIVNGILNSGLLCASDIIMSDVDEQKLQIFSDKKIAVTTDNSYLSKNCNCILLAVKPQIATDVFDVIKDTLCADVVISIMAGMSIAKLQTALGKRNYARIMPNTPALVNEGMSAVAFSEGFSSEFVLDIFRSIGKVVQLDESLFDAVTSLSGSGPAYVYTFIKALIDGGTDGGLDFETAKTLALQTVRGAVEMIEQSDVSIDTLIKNVCSKGGTTIEAVNSFKEDKLEDVVKCGMKKCRMRSVELSKN